MWVTQQNASKFGRWKDRINRGYKDIAVLVPGLLTNYALRHEDVLGSGGIAPLFLTSTFYVDE
jgi:hypothetical protein